MNTPPEEREPAAERPSEPPSLNDGAEPRSNRPFVGTSGALLASAPAPWALVDWSLGFGLRLQFLAAAVTSLALLAAGLSISKHPREGRWLASLGVVGMVPVALPHLRDAPGLTLLLGVVLVLGLSYLWRFATTLVTPKLRRSEAHAGRVRWSGAMALVLWVAVALGPEERRVASSYAVCASELVAIWIGARWALGLRARGSRARVLLFAIGASCVLALLAPADPAALSGCGALYALVATLTGPSSTRKDDAASHLLTSIAEHPERMLATTFATMAFVGTIALALPLSASGSASVGTLDAAFTAVSAVCVTGLAVRDTASEFSAFGQVVLLLLMQLGGLGIMTFSTAALRFLGGRLSFRQESAVAQLVGVDDRSRLVTSAQDVLRVTFACEAVGAVLLALMFAASGDSTGMAIWRGVFTSVSAFCNAGFSLQADSLASYQGNPLLLHTVGALIILGGLSPAVVLALSRRGRSPRPLSVQAKLGLVVTASLLALGFVFFLVSEWHLSLEGLSVDAKLHNAWFQSVTLRTAGFNSVDLAVVHPATWLLMLVMMFIGANPGGTAGGVKTTTIGVLVWTVFDTIKGARETTAFGRRLPDVTIRRAAVVVVLGGLAVVLGSLAILLTQSISVPVALFEVVSALATVGLSQGGTAELDEVGKVIIIACMFVGRISALSLIMFIGQRTLTSPIVLPTEDVAVG